MTDAKQLNREYQPRSLKQNWTTSVLRDEIAILESLTTGCRRILDYGMETEMQREYRNPSSKSIQHLKHIEQNRFGRYAYTPKQNPPRGAVPTFDGTAYPEVIPRFHLPKMPF